MKEFKKQISELREAVDLEVKQAEFAFPKDALETYSAMANTNGGVILLGIKELKDDFELTGIQNVSKVRKELFDSLNNQSKVNKNRINDDDVENKEAECKRIILIRVPSAKYTDKPIYINNNPWNSYKRNFSGDYKCTPDEVRFMMRDSSPESYDSKVCDNYTIADLDQSTIQSYRQRMLLFSPDHPFNSLDDEAFLERINVLIPSRSDSMRTKFL